MPRPTPGSSSPWPASWGRRAGAPQPADTHLTAGPAAPAAHERHLTTVTFSKLWHTFLDRQHHVEEGTLADYTSYGQDHLLPSFGDTDIGLILRTEALRAADVPAGAVCLEDGWLKGMLKKERRNNVGRSIAGTVLSQKLISDVLGQCFDVVLAERPP